MKFPEYTCVECGAEGDANRFLHNFAQSMFEKRLCFTCHHWVKLLELRDDPKTVRAKNHHYRIGSEGDPFPGFAGTKFGVKFTDGRVITTTNLWHQGEIPERFRARLPDNAEFVKDPDMAGRRMP
jgi:hypothetical protein